MEEEAKISLVEHKKAFDELRRFYKNITEDMQLRINYLSKSQNELLKLKQSNELLFKVFLLAAKCINFFRNII